MKGCWILAVVVTAAAALEIVLPGRDVYHAGWYNVALAALVVIVVLTGRAALRKAHATRVRLAIAAIACGAAIAGLAGVANGLFAPDNRTVIGAPGERIDLGDLSGTLDFPLTAAKGKTPAVTLERPGRAALPVGNRARDTGQFVLRTTLRQVVYVEAYDAGGARLTVTQPSGTAFLSPVLLMAQRQTIAGMSLPYDSFAVPAAHRIVKVVLFTPQEAAAMRGATKAGVPAVLFAVDDERDQPLPHAIAFAEEGETVRTAALRLRAAVLAYPAVEVFAVPSSIAVAIGAILVVTGSAVLTVALKTPSYW